MITLIDTENVFDKLGHPLTIKTLSKFGEHLSQFEKEHLQKPAANITVNEESLNVFSLRQEQGQGCLLSPLLLNIVLEFLATVIRQEKGMKGIKMVRKK